MRASKPQDSACTLSYWFCVEFRLKKDWLRRRAGRAASKRDISRWIVVENHVERTNRGRRTAGIDGPGLERGTFAKRRPGNQCVSTSRIQTHSVLSVNCKTAKTCGITPLELTVAVVNPHFSHFAADSL